MKALAKYQATILAIVLLFFATMVLWPGSDCDALFTSIRYAALFAYFCFFLLGLLAWGTLLALALSIPEKSLLLSFALASIWLSSLSGLALLVHTLGEGYRLFLVSFLLFAILFAESLGIALLPWKTLQQKICLSSVALLFFLLLRFAQSTILWGSTDPLFYHLLAPKLWLEQSGMRFIPNMPMLMQASYWEHLYLALFQGIFWLPERSLIEGQILAQWCHCVIGYMGAALVLRRILKNTTNASIPWINLATIAAIFCADLYWTSQTAKNDWGICFWTFSGFLFLPLFHKGVGWQRSEILLAGAFLGFALGAKYSSLLTILPILVLSTYWLARSDGWKKSIRTHGAVALIASLPLGIFCFRNFLLTGDPLFPAYTAQFREINIAKTSIELFNFCFRAQENSLIHLTLALAKNLWSLCENTYAPLLLIPLCFARKPKQIKLPLLGLAFISIIFIYTIARLNVLRYLGPTLPLCIAFSIVAMASIPMNRKLERFLQIGVFLLLIWRSDFFSTDHYGADLISDHPLHSALTDLWRAPNAAVQIRQNHLAGNAKAWLRQNLKAEETVILSAENLSYYLPAGQAFAGFEDRPIDEMARNSKTLLALLPSLRSRKIRYILDTEQWILAPRIALSILSTKAAKDFPDSVVFRDKDSQLIDLSILAKHAGN